MPESVTGECHKHGENMEEDEATSHGRAFYLLLMPFLEVGRLLRHGGGVGHRRHGAWAGMEECGSASECQERRDQCPPGSAVGWPPRTSSL